MSSQLRPIEILCDAPPYQIVRECHRAGIRSPEDVRWLRMTTFRTRQESGRHGLSSLLRRIFRGTDRRADRTCTCRTPLPDMGLLVVTFDAGGEVAYLLGQCHRCLTVFWDELSARAA